MKHHHFLQYYKKSRDADGFERFGVVLFKDQWYSHSIVAFSLPGMLAVQYTYFSAITHSKAATILQYPGSVIITIYIAARLN